VAKAKVQTSRKRVNRKKEELKAPDEVTTALQKLSEHLNKHFKVYLIGLAVILVLSLGINMLMQSRESAAVERSGNVLSAVHMVNGSVATHADSEKLLTLQPQPDAKPVESDYPTDKERWEAALTKLGEVKAEAGDLAPVVSAMQGRVELALGKASEAGTNFAAFAEEGEDSALLPLIIENQGRAAEAAGDLSTAAGFYEKLAGSADAYYKVRGSMLLGDLYNPNMGTGEGRDGAKARSHYDAALEALKPADGKVLNAALRGLRGEISRRRAQLPG